MIADRPEFWYDDGKTRVLVLWLIDQSFGLMADRPEFWNDGGKTRVLEQTRVLV